MKNNIFSNISEEEKNFLVKNSKKVEIKKNGILHSTNEEIKCVSLVLNGELKVVKFSFDGNQQVVKYIRKNETFAEGFIFSGRNYPAYIMAEKDSTILEIPRNIILKLFVYEKLAITSRMLYLILLLGIFSISSVYLLAGTYNPFIYFRF